jgi:hypothetical protein
MRDAVLDPRRIPPIFEAFGKSTDDAASRFHFPKKNRAPSIAGKMAPFEVELNFSRSQSLKFEVFLSTVCLRHGWRIEFSIVIYNNRLTDFLTVTRFFW